MKWLLLIGSLIKPMLFSGATSTASNTIEDFKLVIKENAVKVVFLLAAVISLAIILASGLIMVAYNIAFQIDNNGSASISAIIITGSILVLVSLLVVGIVINSVSSKKEITPLKRQEPQQLINSAHPLQDAMALLIMDFIKEREVKRELRNFRYNTKTNQSEYFRH